MRAWLSSQPQSRGGGSESLAVNCQVILNLGRVSENLAVVILNLGGRVSESLAVKSSSIWGRVSESIYITPQLRLC